MDAGCFSVGDVVRIRQWDDMFEEFGGDKERVLCKYTFTRQMSVSCGAQCKIRDKYGAHVTLDFFDKDLNRKMGGYNFSTDMIEPENYNMLTESVQCVNDFLSGM